MQKGSLAMILLLGAALLVACANGEALGVGDPAPDFALGDTSGNNVSLDEFRDGSPALLYFHMAVG